MKVSDQIHTRLINSLLKRIDLPEEQASEVYGILGTAIAAGQWCERQIKALIIDRELPVDYMQLCDSLRALGYLKRHKTETGYSYSFGNSFLQDCNLHMQETLERLPEAMRPFDTVEPWKYGQRYNDLNIALVKGDTIPSPKAIEALNRSQAVRYCINNHILHLMKDNAHNDPIMWAQWQIADNYKNKPFSFYLTFDYRTREYYRGGLITPQGPDWQKAILDFSQPMLIGKNGKSALRIAAANAYGIKGSMVDRLQWAATNAASMGCDTLATSELNAGASDPWQFARLSIELYLLDQWIDQGNAEDQFPSQAVCHADGSCNGLQHGAALTGNRKTAKLTNCCASTRDKEPEDAYIDAQNNTITNLTGDARLQAFALAAGRKPFKYPVMVTSYGAGKTTCYTAFLKHLTKNQRDAIASDYEVMSEAVAKGIATTAGPLVNLNRKMKKATEKVQALGTITMQWETSDGCIINQDARTKDKDKMNFVGFGKYQTRTDGTCPDAQISSIGPNFVHSMDASHIRAVTLGTKCDLALIHDSIGCHAGAFWHVAKVIRKTFADVHAFDWLGSFNQWNGTNIQIIKGDYCPTEAVKAPYFFL